MSDTYIHKRCREQCGTATVLASGGVFDTLYQLPAPSASARLQRLQFPH